MSLNCRTEKRPTLAGLTAVVAAVLGAAITVTPALALAPEVTQTIALYDAVMSDPTRLPQTCANLRKLSDLQRGSAATVMIEPAASTVREDDTASDGDGWQGAEHERKVTKSRRSAIGGPFGKAALVASDPLLSASAALYDTLVRGSEDDVALRAAAARLFDKCTM